VQKPNVKCVEKHQYERRTQEPLQAVGSFLVGVAFLIAACSRLAPTDGIVGAQADRPGPAFAEPVAQTARDLLVHGALGAPAAHHQGGSMVNYGTTQLGTTSPPRSDTHSGSLRTRSRYGRCVIVCKLAQEGKLSLDDPVSSYVRACPMATTFTIDEKLRKGT